jgi:hypothetical protein
LQWQTLYGDYNGDWAVVTGPSGLVPPPNVGALEHLGEPAVLIAELMRFRASTAREGHQTRARSQLANELGFDVPTLEQAARGGYELRLTSDAWRTLVVNICLMRAAVHAEY